MLRKLPYQCFTYHKNSITARKLPLPLFQFQISKQNFLLPPTSKLQDIRQLSTTPSRLYDLNSSPELIEKSLPKIFKDFGQPENPKIAKIAIVGRANSGKSTLTNLLIGQDVSIVSNKAQTTRQRILLVKTIGNTQLIFLDTPGIVAKRMASKVSRQIISSPWRALDETNKILFVTDASALLHSERVVELGILKNLIKLRGQENKFIFAVNKIDLISTKKRIELAKVVEELTSLVDDKQIVYISALENTNVDELENVLVGMAEDGNWVFPKDATNEMSDIQKVTDIIRAEYFQRLDSYIPYKLRQQVVKWEKVPAKTTAFVSNLHTPGNTAQNSSKYRDPSTSSASQPEFKIEIAGENQNKVTSKLSGEPMSKTKFDTKDDALNKSMSEKLNEAIYQHENDKAHYQSHANTTDTSTTNQPLLSGVDIQKASIGVSSAHNISSGSVDRAMNQHYSLDTQNRFVTLIELNLFVPNNNIRKIVTGKSGSMINSIITSSVPKIGRAIGSKVYLKINVVIEKSKHLLDTSF